MNQQLALVISQEGPLYEGPGRSDGYNDTGLADEIFSGWAVRILDKPAADAKSSGTQQPDQSTDCVRQANQEDHTDQADQAKDQANQVDQAELVPENWLYIETHYGYTGWMDSRDLRLISEEELKQRQDRRKFQRICGRSADLHSQPKVQAMIVETLLRNSFVEILERTEKEDWTLIRSAAGSEGWIPTALLAERKEDDTYLLPGSEKDTFFFHQADKILAAQKEEELRESVVQAAKAYLGNSYRWGGKGSLGIDCSGLAFMSWMENGILIYRDADVRPQYPMYEIDREDLKPGDLIFFPGHVAISLGGARFIHATGFAATPYVTINSLDRNDPDCREDLIDQVTCCASAWKK